MSPSCYHCLGFLQIWLWFIIVMIASQAKENVTDNATTTDHGKVKDKMSIGADKYPGRRAKKPENIQTDKAPGKAAIIEGDIVLGGLFPIHNKGVDTACGEIQPDRGIQRLEAMLFAIRNINKNKTILKDVTLGAKILDTCSRDTYALEQSLEYVRASLSTLDAAAYQCPNGSQAVPKNAPVQVAGVIGGSYSTVSIQVANLFRLFHIPQVSYASTSAALSDKTRYDYFARTVPPDNFQAKAIADIVQYFNWTYVSTVASEGNYGEKGIESFKEEATHRNICIAVQGKIAQTAKEADFDSVVTDLLSKPTARVVVLFLRVEDAERLLLVTKKRNNSNHFIWIASDGWGSQDVPVRDKHEVSEGALTIELQSTNLPEFDAYFTRLSPFDNPDNPWFEEYWEKVFLCHMPSSSTNTSTEARPVCTGKEHPSSIPYKQETKIQFVYDAVHALARALDKMLQDQCGMIRRRQTRKKCMVNLPIDGQKLFKDYLLNVSFHDGYGALVEFNEQGDGQGRYYVFNYRRNRSTLRHEYVKVAKWNKNGLNMFGVDQIFWAGGTQELPVSRCSEPCGIGDIRHADSDPCCWVCIPCPPDHYVLNEFKCVKCDDGTWPTPGKTACHELEEHIMQWGSIYAIIPISLSLVGFVLTIIVIAFFIRHINTPIVKATGRELSFMLLSGFIICFAMTFILLMKPSAIVCGMQRFGVGFGFSVTYSSLLTKTNRISRIFDSASHSARRPPFISPKSQVVICLLLISVQVICNCVWLVLERPGTRHFHPFNREDEIVLKCGIKDQSFLIALVYNMLLIIVCTVYAVKTRKIPENFNESKFIGFSMYTTCIIWLAFVPIYFGTLNSFQIQLMTLCVSISLSAFVALFCLFTPKMYILVFQPEKNIRRLTMNSATYKKGTSSGTNSNIGPSAEHIKMNCQSIPLKMGNTTETETDRDADLDSLASLSN